MNFERLYFLRESLDLYQKDVAKILNINRQCYGAYETGIKIIPLKHLNTLCNFYNVSMDYILSLTNDKNSSKNIDELSKNLIGNNIRMIRSKNNIDQRELAKVLNTTHSNISAYENGKTMLLTAFAYQICKEYNVSLDWLCGRK